MHRARGEPSWGAPGGSGAATGSRAGLGANFQLSRSWISLHFSAGQKKKKQTRTKGRTARRMAGTHEAWSSSCAKHAVQREARRERSAVAPAAAETRSLLGASLLAKKINISIYHFRHPRHYKISRARDCSSHHTQ